MSDSPLSFLIGSLVVYERVNPAPYVEVTIETRDSPLPFPLNPYPRGRPV